MCFRGKRPTCSRGTCKKCETNGEISALRRSEGAYGDMPWAPSLCGGEVVGRQGFEPWTLGLKVRCSDQTELPARGQAGVIRRCRRVDGWFQAGICLLISAVGGDR